MFTGVAQLSTPTEAPVLEITYEDYDLSLNTFSLVEGPGESETFDLGEFAVMKFEFQTRADIQVIYIYTHILHTFCNI